MPYRALKHSVSNRGIPPDSFLDELIAWGRMAPDNIFAPGPNQDIYSNTVGVLGPWQGPEHRRAAMLEVMRVLAGFESSWHWNEGHDPGTAHIEDPETWEAGAWQVSADSMNIALELEELVIERAGADDAATFQSHMKSDHSLAMEYIARLLRHSTTHNGPVRRHEIDPWLKRDAVEEIMSYLDLTNSSARGTSG